MVPRGAGRSGASALRSFVLTLVALSSVACGPSDVVEAFPDELLGTWTTDDPRYAGRSIELTNESLALGAGGDAAVAFRIQEIRATEAGARWRYRVAYRNRDLQLDTLRFTYDDFFGSTIHLEHPGDAVWTKVGS